MKLVCAPKTFDLPSSHEVLPVTLYGRTNNPTDGSAGATVLKEVLAARLDIAPRAWDFLSLALSVIAADLAVQRKKSPDGWTREIDLEVAVSDPIFWTTQVADIEAALAFLTTDRWRINFVDGGMLPAPPRHPFRPDNDSIALLSGGLDSLIGVIDRVAEGQKPMVVSQTVRGDAEKQKRFAEKIGGGIRHLQLNHNVQVPYTDEPSQRARSFIFIAFGVLAATSLDKYHNGQNVVLYICENGFITLNPPLTGARIGSLSTRTAHPVYLARIQKILDAANIKVCLENPYQLKTKGEMLKECSNQELLREEAVSSTSCGRFQRFNYRHCGRCIPCQVRRAAFLAWGQPDTSAYVYDNIGKDDVDHAGFDDVRGAAMAIAEVRREGLESWLGPALASSSITNFDSSMQLIQRGLNEISTLHKLFNVK